jgi:glycine cleavage system H protein
MEDRGIARHGHAAQTPAGADVVTSGDAVADSRPPDRPGPPTGRGHRGRDRILRGHPGKASERADRRDAVLGEEEGGTGLNPEDLHYAASHEWVRVDGGTGTIGITDHAQKELGEIVYLELPEVGHVYNAEEEFGTVESVKAVSELFIPVSGEIVEINKEAVSEPGIVNDDPYGDGWLIKVKLSTDEEVGKLMTADEYAKYLKEEEKEK